MAKRGYLELPDESIAEISSVLEGKAHIPGDAADSSLLLSACKRVARAAKLEMQRIPPLQAHASDLDHLQQIAVACSFRYRRVDLSGSWWRHDHGPLLVFRREDHGACALVPAKRGQGQYYLVESSLSGQEQSTVLDAKTASRLEPTAYLFYRPLPERALHWRDLLAFGVAGLGKDVRSMLLAMAAASLLSLLVPIATGMIFDHVIPSANTSLLLQFILALIVSVLAATLFETTEMIASVRLQLKMNAVLQPALWDRLLRLPVSFFRRYTVGDLADRAGGIDEIQQTITSNVITTAISGVFSIFTLLLMLYYHVGLALVAMTLALVFAVVSTLTVLMEVKYQREMYDVQGRLSGFVLQVLNNISKLRVSNREGVVFQRWLKPYGRSIRLFLRAETLDIRLLVFSSVFSLLATTVLFLMMVSVVGDSLSFGGFIAFNAAFGQFFAAVLGLSRVVTDSLQIVPLYERAKPILSALPEDSRQGIDCGDLAGEIRIEHLSFRYPQYGQGVEQTLSPWVFKDLALTVKPGEFVALVGPSGSGKSTLLRLLLGFESPTSGNVYYDGYSLSALNMGALRRQCGVVLQDSTLLPGTILENITFGAIGIGEEQAWTAARHAAIDQDILAMPMEMSTLIAEGGSNISVGQRQRILIARALAKKPNILIFDEATSALDNVTQQRIARHIESLNITCLIAAHRLSTVIKADRICVFDRGGLVQQGTYAQLLAEDGLFTRLVQRQTL